MPLRAALINAMFLRAMRHLCFIGVLRVLTMSLPDRGLTTLEWYGWIKIRSIWSDNVALRLRVTGRTSTVGV